MIRRGPNESPFAEPGLDALQISMRGGLAQLVPSGHYGSPGFTAYGETNRKDDGRNHLLVRLDIWDNAGAWQAVLGVYDGDDMCIQVWRPLTWESWQVLVDLYQTVCSAGINQTTLGWLRKHERRADDA